MFKNDNNFFKKCSHVTGIFGKIWLQPCKICSYISNYDCNFQDFAVRFWIMTEQVERYSHVIATFNKLQL